MTPLPDDFAQKLAELRLLYLSELPAKLAALEAVFLESGADLEARKTFVRSAHSLAGTGTTFGLPELTRIAREIEYAAKDELSRIDAWSDEFHLDFQRQLSLLYALLNAELESVSSKA